MSENRLRSSRSAAGDSTFPESSYDDGNAPAQAGLTGWIHQVLMSPFLGLVFLANNLTERQRITLNQFILAAVNRSQTSVAPLLMVTFFVAFAGFDSDRFVDGFLVAVLGTVGAAWRFSLRPRFAVLVLESPRFRVRAHVETILATFVSASMWSVAILRIYPGLDSHFQILFLIFLLVSTGLSARFMVLAPPSYFVHSTIVMCSFLVLHFRAPGVYTGAFLVLLLVMAILLFSIAYEVNTATLRIAAKLSRAYDSRAFMETKLHADIYDTHRKAELTLRAAAESKALFLAKISHEFRSPVQVIINAIDILSAELGDSKNELLLRTVRNLGSASAELIHMSDDLAHYLRTASTVIKLKTEELELNQFIRDCVTPHVESAEKKGLTVRFVSNADHIEYTGDGNRLRQILTNLVSNAVKYTVSGGIEVSCEAGQNGQIVIAVKDSGVGIPPGQLRHIFEPWFRADESKQGFGLGLAIVKATADAIGGMLAIDSTVGVGTTISLTLTPRTRAGKAV